MNNAANIMVSNKVETDSGVIFNISSYEDVIVDDFEIRDVRLSAVVCMKYEGVFEIIDNKGYKNDELSEFLNEVNNTRYMVHFYDVTSKDLVKTEVIGLKNILNINISNNIIDIVQV